MSTQLPQAILFEQTTEAETPLTEFQLLAQLGTGETKVTEAPARTIQDYFVDTKLIDGKLAVTYIGSSFSTEDSDLILEWLPRLYGTFSPHVGSPILTEKHLFIHLEAEGLRESEHAKANVVKKPVGRPVDPTKDIETIKFNNAYRAWEEACSERKQKIRDMRTKMKQKVAERERIVAELNNEILQLRIEVQQMEAEPKPRRPVKGDV